MKKAMSISLIFLALVIAIVPAFSDCQSQGRALTTDTGKSVPMKCHWTGIAELGAAVPMSLAGMFSLQKQRRISGRMLALMGVASGVMAILFPTALIGVCANPDMICNMIMKPTLIAGGSLAIAASLVLFFIARDTEMLAPAAA
jgi:hypothetical protein